MDDKDVNISKEVCIRCGKHCMGSSAGGYEKKDWCMCCGTLSSPDITIPIPYNYSVLKEAPSFAPGAVRLNARYFVPHPSMDMFVVIDNELVQCVMIRK